MPCCNCECDATLETITVEISNVTATDAGITCKYGTLFADLPGTYILTKPALSHFGNASGPCSTDYEYAGANFTIALQTRPGFLTVVGFLSFTAGGGCNGHIGVLNTELVITKETGKSDWSKILAGAMTSAAQTRDVWSRITPNNFYVDIGNATIVVSD